MNGILLVDKPDGWTSHDVVAKLRGVFGERRIGHAGTLDPMATGLLVVFLGRATKAVSFAEAQRKRYIARLRLGVVTDTQDTTGNVLSQTEQHVTAAELEAALAAFRGDIQPESKFKVSLKIRTLSLLRQTPDLKKQGMLALTSGKGSLGAVCAFRLRQKLQPPRATATLPLAAC